MKRILERAGRWLIVGSLAGASAAAIGATSYVYYDIAGAPGATQTTISHINSANQIVGAYTYSPDPLAIDAVSHGYLYIGGTYTTIDFPGASSTVANGINDAGQIVGRYLVGASTTSHGFLYSGGVFSTIDVPGAVSTTAYGIDDTGRIAGSYNLGPGTGGSKGFLDVGGTFTFPINAGGAGTTTTIRDINSSGQITGWTNSNADGQRGFVGATTGPFTTIAAPGSTFTGALAMNDAGQVAGFYGDNTSISGLLYSGGVFTTLNPSWDNGLCNTINGINDSGVIVGNGCDALGNNRNYYGVPAILPSGGDGAAGYNFELDILAGQTYYIDPVVATGYTYATGAGNPAFASVVLPIGIGDNLYELWLPDGGGFVDSGFSLTGGIPFSFLTHGFANGLTEFQIQGIETGAGLDPNDPLAFATGLTFVGDGKFTGSMTPLTANVPEPTTLALLGLGLAGLGFSRRKQ